MGQRRAPADQQAPRQCMWGSNHETLGQEQAATMRTATAALLSAQSPRSCRSRCPRTLPLARRLGRQ